MAEEGSPTPRRALGPLPDQPEDTPDGGGYGHALPPEEPSPLTSTGRLRRLAVSPTSPASPAVPPATPARTPVPPPAPVLPESQSSLRPASGRRFSATDDPFEHSFAAPRRSAVSPASPPSVAPLLPPPPRPTTPPAVRIPGAATFTPSPYAPSPAAGPLGGTPAAGPVPQPTPVAPSVAAGAFAAASLAGEAAASPRTAEPEAPVAEAIAPAKRRGLFGRKTRAGDTGAPAVEPPPATVELPPAIVEPTPAVETPAVPEEKPKGKRSARPALIVISAVAVVALLVVAGVWLFALRSGAPSGEPTNPDTASALDPLVTAADLGSLGGVTWTATTATSDAARPICLPATGAGVPNAQRSVSRETKASDDQSAAFVQAIDTYADDTAATQAYTARTVQAGTCAEDVAWITGANSVSGLADAAISERLVVEGEASGTFHTLLISRTGRSVSLIDITTTKSPVNALDLANVAGQALSRQCGGDQGTCPSSIGVATVPPPAGDPAGWLVEADVPRVTPGAGRWGATDPKTTLDVIGSQCEAMNLQAVSGTQSAGQRTLLLADDNAAPKGFGIDMVTYTFSGTKDAANLSAKLSENISKCNDRAPTATVVAGPAAKGTGEGDLKFSGDTFEITQKTETTTVLYRVAVLTVDTKVVYLLANPTTGFDFTDSQWKAVAVRAGQRATQG